MANGFCWDWICFLFCIGRFLLFDDIWNSAMYFCWTVGTMPCCCCDTFAYSIRIASLYIPREPIWYAIVMDAFSCTWCNLSFSLCCWFQFWHLQMISNCSWMLMHYFQYNTFPPHFHYSTGYCSVCLLMHNHFWQFMVLLLWIWRLSFYRCSHLKSLF